MVFSPSMMSLMEGPEALEEERRLCYVGDHEGGEAPDSDCRKEPYDEKVRYSLKERSRFIDEIPDVCLERPDQDDSKTGWKKMADGTGTFRRKQDFRGRRLPARTEKRQTVTPGRFQNRPAGVSLFGQKSDAYKNPYASGTSAAPKNTPTFGKAFTVEKPKSLDFSEGDRVHHMRFGDGTVKSIADGGKRFRGHSRF